MRAVMHRPAMVRNSAGLVMTTQARALADSGPKTMPLFVRPHVSLHLRHRAIVCATRVFANPYFAVATGERILCF